ncbi:MAG TPA: OpgC domain-containing protein [Alphaproteobacteria bacterium]
MNTTTRDLRLDFFRGLSLLFIFVDHIPGNAFSYVTLANLVFNDAAEVFVFISGYTAAIVFGRMALRSGTTFAVVQVLSRCWTLYVAHIFLFVLFTAQVAYTAEKFANPMFVDEMKVAAFLDEPHVAITKALLLQFQPMFMGILPLYIVLLLGFAAVLPVIHRRGTVIITASAILYAATLLFELNLPAYPDGHWFHNPFAWQILFVIGALCGIHAGSDRLSFLGDKRLFAAAAIFLTVSIVTKLLLTLDNFVDIVPAVVVEGIWLFLDKTSLGPLRLLNFLALAAVVVRFVPPDSPVVNATASRAIVRCGQHSLYIFCLGILLSYLGHFILTEIDHSLVLQFTVSAGGVLVMFAAAAFLSWARAQGRATAAAHASPETKIARQGGE